MARRMKKLALIVGSTVLVLGLLIQLVPYGRSHSNPPTTAEPGWDSPATRAVVKRACFDCHSNETRWPWYASVAPSSWMLEKHVVEGRDELNFSEWQRGQDLEDLEDLEELEELVRSEEMPPWSYRVLHPEARLTAEEQTQLINGLRRSLGARGSRSERD